MRHIHLKEIDGRDEELDDATEAEEADAAVDEKEAGLKALREEMAGAGEEDEDEDDEEEEEES